MSNALTLFDMPAVTLPSHVANFFGEESNIENRVTVPSLAYEGKVWTISVNGEKTKLMKRNEEGDEEPLSVMRVVVLDYNKRRGRAYYEGAYDPAKPGTPLCWSDDGVTPDMAVKEPKASKCQDCPMSVKGSKVTEQGKAVTACAQHRMVVVVPANKLDFQPLRMKLAITSDWDKNSPELEQQGWFAFNNYTDMLRSKSVNHTAALVTKMRFDPNVAYPKVIFSPDRWLDENELKSIAPVVRGETVKNLLSGTWTPNGSDGVKIDGDRPDTSLLLDEAPKPAPKAAPKAAPKPAPVAHDEDDSGVIEVAAKPVEPKKQPEPKKVAAEVPDDVAALLADWGDD